MLFCYSQMLARLTFSEKRVVIVLTILSELGQCFPTTNKKVKILPNKFIVFCSRSKYFRDEVQILCRKATK